MAEEESLINVYDVNEIMQAGWFGFMEEIVSNANNFLLYSLFNH